MQHASSTTSERALHKNSLFLRILLPSILSIVACVCCLTASSWAWFTANISVSVDEISSSEIGSVTIENVSYTGSADPVCIKSNNSFTVAGGCKIITNQNSYFAGPGTYKNVGDTDITVIPWWSNNPEKIQDISNCTQVEKNEETVVDETAITTPEMATNNEPTTVESAGEGSGTPEVA